uniref:Uncharacterized protein n=1 Tax=Kalanchoe fedtschenkoi TaxID=63787 RepID=A0A7N0U4U3_KALFE
MKLGFILLTLFCLAWFASISRCEDRYEVVGDHYPADGRISLCKKLDDCLKNCVWCSNTRCENGACSCLHCIKPPPPPSKKFGF